MHYKVEFKMKAQSKKVNVAIVGAGAIASLVHIPIWKRIPNSKLVGIYDIVSGKSTSIARQNQIPIVYADLEDLIEDDNVDLVDICTPIHTHIPIIQAALKANKHVITEKPLSSKSQEASHVVKLSEQRNLVLAVSQNHLYSTAVRSLKRRIIQHQLGELLLLNISYPISIYKSNHWTANLATGGLLFELGIHPAYIAIYLFGNPENIEAFGNNPLNKHPVGGIVINLLKNRSVCNIVLPPVEDQPTIRVFGTKAYELINLFANSNDYNKDRITQEYGSTSMRAMTKTGSSLLNDWVKKSTKVTWAYIKKGIRYFFKQHRALNQYTFFNEVTSQILHSDEKLRRQNRRYLEVAINSIQLLEKVKICLAK